jgi:hypothetical protein
MRSAIVMNRSATAETPLVKSGIALLSRMRFGKIRAASVLIGRRRSETATGSKGTGTAGI